jgi:hypothetical protein
MHRVSDSDARAGAARMPNMKAAHSVPKLAAIACHVTYWLDRGLEHRSREKRSVTLAAAPSPPFDADRQYTREVGFRWPRQVKARHRVSVWPSFVCASSL